MNRKTLILTAMTLAVICSGAVVSEYATEAFAKTNDKTEPVVYALDNEEYAEILSNLEKDGTLLSEKELLEDPRHNLSVDYTDGFVYTRTTPVEYVLGDKEHAFNTDMSKLETHILEEVKGNSIPAYFWDLNNRPYQYAIANMQNYVYTDYYFNISSNNSIEMSMGTLNSGGRNITITLYEVGTNNAVMSWTGNPQSLQGLGWGPINPNKQYYFRFSITSGTLSGSGIIHH